MKIDLPGQTGTPGGVGVGTGVGVGVGVGVGGVGAVVGVGVGGEGVGGVGTVFAALAAQAGAVEAPLTMAMSAQPT